MRRSLCLALVLAQGAALAASGAADAQSAASSMSAALDGAPPMHADRNRLNDIETADPSTRISVIAPPQASNMGDASVAYPLDLPPGRQGVEPKLDIHYSSGGANGWTGLGWDLSIPSVAIETRWGVPRYDPGVETETYVLAGEQLTPVAHRGILQGRSAERAFHTRIEGGFERITRHGNHPSNYAWEVTDKSGMRYFYGDDPSGPAGTHTLRDDSGNVFRWALRLVQDPLGNSVAYTYALVVDPGVSGGGVPGYQLYPKGIEYTRTAGGPGAHTVTFVRDRELGLPRRSDVAIDARGGFKMVTADLLKRVEIAFNGQRVRRYDLDYTTGTYGESLLSAITQRGEDLSLFHAHTFEYYSEPRGFGAAEAWNPGNDGVTIAEISAVAAEAVSALGGSITGSIGGHVYIGFNPSTPTKKNSFGGKIGFNFSQNDGLLELVDINGDGLPDKVFKMPFGVFVRYNQSGPGGGSTFGPAIALPTLPGISTERNFTISAGAEAYPAAANVMVNFSESFGIGSTYFADVNSDGLLDLVSDGQVLFNHYGGSGNPVFGPDSASTGVPVAAGSVDANGVVPDYESSYQRQIDMFPLADSVRRWVAPYDGVIDISGAAALVQSSDPARASYQTADGVRVAIQHNGAELWADRIFETDYSLHTPAGVGAVAVHAGDRIYFRVQSIFDGSYDDVAWDPVIAYANQPPTTDVNGRDPYRYQASTDFVFAGRPHSLATAPLNGVVRLAGDLRKLAATTDDVTVVLTRNGQPALQKSLSAAQVGDIVIADDIPVSKGDTLELRVAIDSPIDLSAIQWAPSAYYVVTPDVDPGGNPIPLFDDQNAPLVKLSLVYDESGYPIDGLAGPQGSWAAPSAGTVTVSPQIAGAPGASGSIVFTVKKRGALLAKQVIAMSGGVAAPTPLAVNVAQDDEIFFDFSIADPDLGTKITAASVQVNGSAVPSAVHRAAVADLFPIAYRGWSVAGYNGNRGYANMPIDESRLTLPSGDVENNCDPSQISTQDEFSSSGCNPSNATAWAYSPMPTDGMWRGTAEAAFVAAGGISASRAGPPYISVPRPEQFLAARAVNRTSHNTQIAVGGGIGPASFSATPFGQSDGDMDFLDLNGDGFPDVVGNGNVQYTLADGGLEAASHAVAGMGGLRRSLNFAEGIGVAGNPASSKSNAKGRVGASGHGSPKGNGSGNQMSTLGLSGDLGLGQSDVTAELMDINGDGLPDRVYHDIGQPLRVSLNLGYRFAAPEVWGSAAINEGASANFSVGVSPSFNSGDYELAGGVSLGADVSQAGCKFVDPILGNCHSSGSMLTDVNGDGLPDRVSPDGSSLRVALNLGHGFAPEIGWSSPMGGSIAKSRNLTLGGGVYFTIPIGPLCVGACYLIINPGIDGSVSLSRQEAAILDVDGDGYPDHVTSGWDGQLTVARNLRGRTGLLKTIHRPLRAVIDLEYERDGNTFAHAESRWTLSRVSTHDGHPGDGVDTRATTFRYDGGYHDRLEREFYGYSQVVAEERDTAQGDALYRSVVRTYRNDSYYTRGLMIGEKVLDAAGRPFTETVTTYDFRDVETNGPVDLASSTATIFPMKVRTDQLFYEGNAAPGKSTFATYVYDSFGRITLSTTTADIGLDDDVIEATEYADCPATYVLDVPTRVVTRDGHGTTLRQGESTVDCNTGLVTQSRAYIDAQTAAVTDIAYDANGNIQQIQSPVNGDGQRYQVSYGYDAPTATYPTSTLDSFGYVTTSAYDLKHGVPLQTTDANQRTTSYTYDVFGRIESVRMPREQGSGPPTVRYEYHHDDAVPWAITRRFDALRAAGDTIDSVAFVDGAGRVIQTKHDAAVFAGAGVAPSDVMIVSGARTYDLAGRVSEERHPIVEPLGSAGVWNPAVDAAPPKVTTYDVLDRTLVTTDPDGTQWSQSFGFGQDNAGNPRLLTSVQDPNGVHRFVYRDVRSLPMAEQQRSDGGLQVIWTSYAYNAMMELTDVVDDHGNVTLAAYDNLGRRTAIQSPDSGYTQLDYDPAGNLVRRVTPNLQGTGESIEYHYDFNRLTDVVYPLFPENAIHYTYGPPGAPEHGAGAIVRVDDSSGHELMSYDDVGEISRRVRTVVEKPSRGGGELGTYTTELTYDTFGRLVTLTYPDGEVLSYAYDSGGRLRAAAGLKNGVAYTYASRMEYDKFDALVYTQAGNGVETAYTFDPLSRHLTRLRSGKGSLAFQDVAYTYDAIGNVLSLSNNVPMPPPSEYGGPSSQAFVYDDLSRLTAAAGTYRFAPGKDRTYSLSLSYDTIHNITQKDQTDTIYNTPNKGISQHDTTYSTGYTYGQRPHALVHADGRTFTYDEDGNQAGWDSDKSGQRRTIVWNEDDRIESISDNGSLTFFQYDAAGSRVLRRGPSGRTIYVNAYFTDEPGANAQKHVFAGAMRIASKPVKTSTPENVRLFYHVDHAGNTTYITDAGGALFRHLEYFPFGETWVEDASSTNDVPYLFAGKELDESTGLYYFGARYYDPRTSQWQSADPALGDYLSGAEGGLQNPLNAQLYGYGYQNPLRFIDPDGHTPKGYVRIYRVVRPEQIHDDNDGAMFQAKAFEKGERTQAGSGLAASRSAVQHMSVQEMREVLKDPRHPKYKAVYRMMDKHGRRSTNSAFLSVVREDRPSTGQQHFAAENDHPIVAFDVPEGLVLNNKFNPAEKEGLVLHSIPRKYFKGYVDQNALQRGKTKLLSDQKASLRRRPPPPARHESQPE